MRRLSTFLGAWALFLSIVSVAAIADNETIRIALDWTPNTNHTGLFLAAERGYFEEEGLSAEIVQPGPTGSIHLVASGRCELGVSMQEYVTMARSQGIPVVSIAAVLPHNTSGFAAPRDRGIVSPRDFEGRRYGGWGSELEEVMIRTVMEEAGADFGTVEMVHIGTLDFVTAVRRDLADFFWIFYGWQGIHAEIEGIDFVYLPLVDFSERFDYYTPVLIASEAMIAEDPIRVRAALRAIARGYVAATLDPAAGAEALLRAAPELDRELVVASQEWIAQRSEADLSRWGRQEEATWRRFAEWAEATGLIDRPIDPAAAFTNALLPADPDRP